MWTVLIWQCAESTLQIVIYSPFKPFGAYPYRRALLAGTVVLAQWVNGNQAGHNKYHSPITDRSEWLRKNKKQEARTIMARLLYRSVVTAQRAPILSGKML